MNTTFTIVKDLISEPRSSITQSRAITISPGAVVDEKSPLPDTVFSFLNYTERYSIVLSYVTPAAIMYLPMTRTSLNYNLGGFTQNYQNVPSQSYGDVAFVLGGLRAAISTTTSDFLVAARGGSSVIAGSHGVVVVGAGSNVVCGESCLVCAETNFKISCRPGTLLDVDGTGLVEIFTLDGGMTFAEVREGFCGIATAAGIIPIPSREMHKLIATLPLNMVSYNQYGTRAGSHPAMRAAIQP